MPRSNITHPAWLTPRDETPQVGDYRAINLELELFNPELREKPQARATLPRQRAARVAAALPARLAAAARPPPRGHSIKLPRAR